MGAEVIMLLMFGGLVASVWVMYMNAYLTGRRQGKNKASRCSHPYEGHRR